MGERTAIEWTDHTFNPWWGCTRVSPGCQHCYAETFAKRTGHDVWGKTAPRRFFGDKHWNEPLKWDARAKAEGVRRRVFTASMADVFEDESVLDDDTAEQMRSARSGLWKLIEQTPNLDWLLLTKRPGRVAEVVPVNWMEFTQCPVCSSRRLVGEGDGQVTCLQCDAEWVDDPLWPSNVWIGTTVEDQQRADERIPLLRSIPAPVRFLSCEPLLGPVDLRGKLDGIHWVIVGGESGPGARPMHPDWARGVRDAVVNCGSCDGSGEDASVAPRASCSECDGTGLPARSFLFKQHGDFAAPSQLPRALGATFHGPFDTPVRVGKKAAGRVLDGRTWDEVPS